MRRPFDPQQPLIRAPLHNKLARELAMMSEILDDLPAVVELVHADLTRDKQSGKGRMGMTAEQVMRALIIKQMNGFSYEELEFHLADSSSFRAFCRLGEFDKSYSRSTLQENIKKITPVTLEQLNRAMVGYAQRQGLETGAKVRVDSTSVESNIHEPTDSSLLFDVVRTLVRLMKKGRKLGARFHNHQRQAKSRAYQIFNAKKSEDRVPLYRDLLKITENTLKDAEVVVPRLRAQGGAVAEQLAGDLEHFIGLGRKVVDQAYRRVIQDEKVPSSEKLVSIFEEHTDILVKGQREVEYGHKVFVSTGASSLILDCIIEDGNPADKTLAIAMVDRHIERHGVAPKQAAFDGGFASQANLRDMKERGVEDVMFSKTCGLDPAEMVSSTIVFRALRHFRAGVEACISFLKRSFGMSRCTWSGPTSFRAYVWSAVVSANALLLARLRLASA